jgi:hypothetical protein
VIQAENNTTSIIPVATATVHSVSTIKPNNGFSTNLKNSFQAPFLITFTIPETLRPFMRAHPRLSYQTLFKASSEAIKRLAKDKRFIGTELLGFTGILQYKTLITLQKDPVRP